MKRLEYEGAILVPIAVPCSCMCKQYSLLNYLFRMILISSLMISISGLIGS